MPKGHVCPEGSGISILTSGEENMEALLLTRDFETRLHGHYHLQGYWVDESAPRKNSR